MRRARSVEDYIANASNWQGKNAVGIGLDDRYRGQGLKSQASGLMFAFRRNRLVGSNFFLTASNRSKFPW